MLAPPVAGRLGNHDAVQRDPLADSAHNGAQHTSNRCNGLRRPRRNGRVDLNRFDVSPMCKLPATNRLVRDLRSEASHQSTASTGRLFRGYCVRGVGTSAVRLSLGSSVRPSGSTQFGQILSGTGRAGEAMVARQRGDGDRRLIPVAVGFVTWWICRITMTEDHSRWLPHWAAKCSSAL